ncbi:hypothetical protein AAT19DRAFT_10534 [Rhodotorula toruloides]|uniref:Uncharacterized protein n=1 Tax=Rhodotorula toruloides TaxID=5286 RepID=A0A2S9ZZ26_RHOTO|nr:hypothetical protein AAT19DRAFT_10534 [Rhodotorula toruloides]
MSRWKGKGRATEAEEDAEMSSEEDARQNGANGRVTMAATAFMPLANFRTEPAKPSPRSNTPMRHLQPPPMPLASSSSGSASRQPPSKRARRVLATEEEMEEWEREKNGRKNEGAAEDEKEDGAEGLANGRRQIPRLSDTTAPPLNPQPPPPPRPAAAPLKPFHPLTAFGLSPSLTPTSPRLTTSSSSSTKRPARPAPVSALGRLPLPLPAPGRPKTPTTPREAESKPTRPLANLSSLLPVPSPATPKEKDGYKEKEKKPILALAPSPSLIPSGAGVEDGETEEGEDEWSPRKKGRGKGYLQCVSLPVPLFLQAHSSLRERKTLIELYGECQQFRHRRTHVLPPLHLPHDPYPLAPLALPPPLHPPFHRLLWRDEGKVTGEDEAGCEVEGWGGA